MAGILAAAAVADGARLDSPPCAESSGTSGRSRPRTSSSRGCGGWSTAATTPPASRSSTDGAIACGEAGRQARQPREGARRRRRCPTSTTGIGHTRWATHGAPNDVNAHPHLGGDRPGRAGAQRDHRELRRAARRARGRRATSCSPRPTPRSPPTCSSSRCWPGADLTDGDAAGLPAARGRVHAGRRRRRRTPTGWSPPAATRRSSSGSARARTSSAPTSRRSSSTPARRWSSARTRSSRSPATGVERHRLRRHRRPRAGATTSTGTCRPPRRTATTGSCARRSTSSRRRSPTRCSAGATPSGRAPARRDAALRRGAARHRQDHHHRLRHVVLRRHGREVRHRALDPDPGRGRAGLGVPLPRPDPRPTRRWWSRSASPARPPTRCRRSGTRARSGRKVLAICNTNGSTIPRESDAVIYTHAGPEIGVASTKGFLTQLVACYLLGALPRPGQGHEVRRRDRAGARPARGDARPHPAGARPATRRIYELAREHVDARSVLFLGRHAGYPVALEGALKLKELAYIHAEGFAAGELKHGPIALIEEGLPVFCVVPPQGRDQLHDKMVSGIQEVRARGARTICWPRRATTRSRRTPTTLIRLPQVPMLLQPLVAVVPLQLFACELATRDGPRRRPAAQPGQVRHGRVDGRVRSSASASTSSTSPASRSRSTARRAARAALHRRPRRPGRRRRWPPGSPPRRRWPRRSARPAGMAWHDAEVRLGGRPAARCSSSAAPSLARADDARASPRSTSRSPTTPGSPRAVVVLEDSIAVRSTRAHGRAGAGAAEAALMATLPDGALMQRAAAGLAYAVLDLLGSAYGRAGAAAGRRPGDNGGDALYAGALLARRGCAVEAVLLVRPGARGRAGRAARRRRPGRRRAADVDARPDVVVDGIVGIGGRPGLRPEAAAALAAVAGRPGRRRRRPVAASTSTPGELDGPHVDGRRHRHVRHPQGRATSSTRRRRRAAPSTSSTSGLDLPDAGGRGAPGRRRRRAAAAARRATRTSTPAASSASAPARRATPAPACSASPAPSSGLAGMVRYVGDARSPTWSGRASRGRSGTGRVQAWVVGSGGGDDARRRLWRRRSPTACRSSSTPTPSPHVDRPARRAGGAHPARRRAGRDARRRPRRRRGATRSHHAREPRQRYDAVVLLKGRHTLVADPDGRVRVTTTGVAVAGHRRRRRRAGRADRRAARRRARRRTTPAPVGSWLHGAAATLASARRPARGRPTSPARSRRRSAWCRAVRDRRPASGRIGPHERPRRPRAPRSSSTSPRSGTTCGMLRDLVAPALR